ncbi:MAG: aldo/keto reductase [Bacteroidetes bacterium]|nr:aldo/keto reductase [Bacteroidota bacterium]
MEYRRLGRSGLQLSELSFGTWITFGNQIPYATAKNLFVAAYDAGVNFFDNAEVYAHGESERVMGRILSEVGWSRDSYTVSSKVFFGAGGKLPTQRGLHRKHVVEACHQALERLRVDYLDLYFCHRPDKATPIDETVWTMHQLIMQGKILYWGTSEWSAEEIMDAQRVADQHHLIGPTMEQPQYNLLHREKMESEFLRLFERIGLGTTIWSPLASGILTNKYRDGLREDFRLNRDELSWLKDRNVVEEKLAIAGRLADLAAELSITPAQLGIAWCLKNPHVSTVMLGATRVEQLHENLKSAEAVALLTPEVMERIEGIVGNKPVLAPY